MRLLDPIEDEALKDQAACPSVETHRTHLLKRLFTLAGEQLPTALAQTADETYDISISDLDAVVQKLGNKLSP